MVFGCFWWGGGGARGGLDLCPLARSVFPCVASRRSLNGCPYPAIRHQVNTGAGNDELATCYGAKPAALGRFLKDQVLATEGKAIVFSMWDDVLHIIAQTLKELQIPSLFCEGDGKAKDKVRHFPAQFPPFRPF